MPGESKSLLQELRRLGEESSYPHLITSKARRVLYVNQPFLDLCRFSAPDIIGQNPGHKLQGAETNPEVVDLVRRLLKSHSPFEFQIVNYRNDGEPYRAGIIIFPFHCGAGDYFLAIERELVEGEDPLSDPGFERALRQAACQIEDFGGSPAALN